MATTAPSEAATSIDTVQRTSSLVVDSGQKDLDHVCSILRFALGTDPRCAQSTGAALKILNTSRPALVLIENGLADGRGIDLAIQMRQIRGHFATPIILFNDWSSPFLQEKAAMARIALMVQKRDLHPSHVRKVLRPDHAALTPKH